MHDPLTVAFDVRWPWPRSGERWRRPILFTVWHKDPALRGDDDSCGWSRPKLSDKQRETLKSLAWWEAREPWFQKLEAKSDEDPIHAEAMIRAALVLTARWLRLRISYQEVSLWAIELTHNHSDNLRSKLALLAGWHTNSSDPNDEYWRNEQAMALFASLAVFILGERRRWWQHPRWHVWHWSIQVPFVQNLQRWLFSRCCRCGGRFTWGYSPTTDSWNGSGPRWFIGEPGVYHSDCWHPGASALTGAA